MVKTLHQVAGNRSDDDKSTFHSQMFQKEVEHAATYRLPDDVDAFLEKVYCKCLNIFLLLKFT